MKHLVCVSGSQYKLLSGSNALLGIVTIPVLWAKYLRHTGRVSFNPQGAQAGEQIRVATLLAVDAGGCEALVLSDASLEELEAMPGVAFSPSAYYLRSILI